jgi:hypothetical protein
MTLLLSVCRLQVHVENSARLIADIRYALRFVVCTSTSTTADAWAVTAVCVLHMHKHYVL